MGFFASLRMTGHHDSHFAIVLRILPPPPDNTGAKWHIISLSDGEQQPNWRQNMSREQRLIYVGMHDGVCAVISDDDGKTWRQGPVTHLPHAAARLAASPVNRERAWLSVRYTPAS